jgi:hypothetical protein
MSRAISFAVSCVKSHFFCCFLCFVASWFADMVYLFAESLLNKTCCFYRNIDDVDKTMDEINDNMENMRQIQDLLSAPMGAVADFDDVSLSLPVFAHTHMSMHTYSFFVSFFPEIHSCIVLFLEIRMLVLFLHAEMSEKT